jgi:hypothetical protein
MLSISRGPWITIATAAGCGAAERPSNTDFASRHGEAA